MKIISSPAVFGIMESKPLKGFPPGKIRLKIQSDDFAFAYVETEEGTRKFAIIEQNGFWIAGPELKMEPKDSAPF